MLALHEGVQLLRIAAISGLALEAFESRFTVAKFLVFDSFINFGSQMKRQVKNLFSQISVLQAAIRVSSDTIFSPQGNKLLGM